MATKKLLYAMVRVNTTARLVFTSSSSVYGAAETYPTSETELLRPISPYGVTKASAEQLVNAYVMQYAMDAVILRYFTVYGPRQRPDMAFSRWISAALNQRTLYVYGNGSAVRDFTYVGDVVSATVGAVEVAPNTYNVAGGSPASISAAIEVIGELTGGRLDVKHQASAKGDPARTGGDVSLLRKELAWEPQVDLKEGLKRQVQWVDER